ncbi:MAG: DUF2075 domain-containing protein [Candidatus Thermoplasmatota archaeon]
MRLYSGSSEQFIEDTYQNQIAEKLRLSFFEQYGHNPSGGEVNSWRNSLRSISMVFQHADLLDHGVMVEYQLPLTSRRLDCLICGHDGTGRDNAVIVELKQWDRCSPADGANEVLTWVGGSEREVLHPSVQVGQYRNYLEDTHTAFYDGSSPIRLNACTYLHNYSPVEDDAILAEKFSAVIERNPLYTMSDVDSLEGYLTSWLSGGHGLETLRRVEESKCRPSKKLMDHVGSVIKGKPEYILLDDQLVVYDKVLACAKGGFHDRKKSVMIVRGGPGTGKSVIAINLMADLLLKGFNAQYATGSRAFTETLRKVIGPRGGVQFKYFNSYTEADYNSIDVLLADEAHRIRENSSSRFTARAKRSTAPQIDELLRAAKVSVFFIDDHQVVRPGEIGSTEYIRNCAGRLGCSVFEYELETQFRCAGSEAFVGWVNNTLGVQRTANALWNPREEFDFRIMKGPEEVERAVLERVAEGHTGRMVAGFCWPWSDPRPDGTLVDDVVVGDYRRPWNARPEARRLAKGIPKAMTWAYDPNGIRQVGCVYTAQGFEFDYGGVIFGEDLVYDLDAQGWRGQSEYSHDKVVKRSRERFTDLVKNTYRVLLTRGMKGCYVCFLDRDTERFVKSRIDGCPLRIDDPRIEHGDQHHEWGE